VLSWLGTYKINNPDIICPGVCQLNLIVIYPQVNGKKIELLCACVDESVAFVPTAQYLVFLNYADVHVGTAELFCFVKRMVQQFFADALVTVIGMYAEVVQLAGLAFGYCE